MCHTQVNISKLEYSGGPSTADAIKLIKSYINSLETQRLDKSDLVNLLYNNGATYVNLNMEISFRQFDLFMKKAIKSFIEQTYEVASGDLNKFYTDETELLGVEQI